MRNFKRRTLSLIERSMSQVDDLINEAFDTINDIDWDNCFAQLNEKRENLIRQGNLYLDEIVKLLKEAKESLTDFEVSVDYDEDNGESIEYSVENGKLKVVVSYEDESTTYNNTKIVTIPQNCDTSALSMRVDKALKKATITVPRAIPESVEHSEELPNSESETPQTQEENEASVASELEERLRRNISGVRNVIERDSQGRFVRRSVN